MSARNARHNKKIRALRRALRKGRLPARIDLETWLLDRRYANTAGRAREIIMDGLVKSESHPLGTTIVEIDEKPVKVYDPLVPARLRNTIRCEAPRVKSYYEVAA